MAALPGFLVLAHIGDPRPGRHVGQIGNPQLVRAAGVEPTLDQVRRADSALLGAGGAHRPTSSSHPFDAGGPHEADHLVPAHVVAGPPGGIPELVGPADLAMRHPQGHQDRHQHRVADRPR